VLTCAVNRTTAEAGYAVADRVCAVRDECRFSLGAVTKRQKKDAPVKNPVTRETGYVAWPGTPVLPIRATHVIHIDRLTGHHKDSCTTVMLVSQFIVEGLPLGF